MERLNVRATFPARSPLVCNARCCRRQSERAAATRTMRLLARRFGIGSVVALALVVATGVAMRPASHSGSPTSFGSS